MDLWPPGAVHPPCIVHEEIANMFFKLTQASASRESNEASRHVGLHDGRKKYTKMKASMYVQGLSCAHSDIFDARKALTSNHLRRGTMNISSLWTLTSENDKAGWIFDDPNRTRLAESDGALSLKVNTLTGHIVITFLRSYNKVGNVSLILDGMRRGDLIGRWDSRDSLSDVHVVTSSVGDHEVTFLPHIDTEYFKIMAVKGCQRLIFEQ